MHRTTSGATPGAGRTTPYRSRLPPALAARLRRDATALLPLGRERLRDYVAAESPSGDAAALGVLAGLVAEGHAATGGHPGRFPGPAGDHLVTTWGDPAAADGHLLLLGHLDTVWPTGRLSTMPYTDDGELITGPGAYDMKGGLVVLELAMRLLHDAGTAPARAVRAVLVADEEVGSPHGRGVVDANLGGAAAVFGLEAPHPDGALKTARRGSTRVRLTVLGREAHAAADPGTGVSAIDELLDQLAAARRAVADDGTTLCNVGRVGGGSRSNVVAGEAWAEIGLRFPSREAERQVLAAVLAPVPRRRGAHVTAEVLSSRPAWPPAPDSGLLDHVARVATELGSAELDGPATAAGRPAAGAADTNLPGARGLPTLDGFGPRGRGAHAADEAVLAASIAERAALLAGVFAAT